VGCIFEKPIRFAAFKIHRMPPLVGSLHSQ